MELNFYEKLQGIDIAIVVVYLLFVVLLGLYFGSKHKNAEDYFLAGRNLTWPIIALFVMGLFWKKANTRGAYWTIIVGFVITVFSIAFHGATWKPHFLYMTGLHFLASCIAMVIGSLSGGKQKTEEEIENTVWSPRGYRAETVRLQQLPWYKNYRIHAVILMVMVVIILLVY